MSAESKSKISCVARSVMTLLAFLMMTGATHAEPYAVYSNDNHTLYFTQRNGMGTSLSAGGLFTPEDGANALRPTWWYQLESLGGEEPYWEGRTDLGEVTRVIFEPSFADVKPTKLRRWFNGFSGMTSIEGLENLDTSDVTDMAMLFSGCSSLSSINLLFFNTSKVTTMNSMFQGCSSLTTLDISSFNTKEVNAMTGMFASCGELVSIYISQLWNISNVISSGAMFGWCRKIVGQDGTTYSGSITDKRKAHAGEGGYMRMVKMHTAAVYCASTRTLYFTSIYRVPSDNYYIPENTSTRLPITAFWSDTDVTATGTYPAWYGNTTMKDNVTTVVFEPSFRSQKPTSTCRWFADFRQLSSVRGIGNLDTSEVTTMLAMFYGCPMLTTLDLSGFDVGKVADLSSLFSGCTGLTTLDLTHFNTGSLTETTYMFKGCSNLVSVFIGNKWNLSRVSVPASTQMFYGCTSIVGQDGTTYDDNAINKTKAHAGTGGYLRIHVPSLTLHGNSDNTSLIAEAAASDNYYDVAFSDYSLLLDGAWNTLCLPFSLNSLAGTPLEGFTVKELDTSTAYDGHKTGYDNGTLYLNFKDATGIKAGTPYLVKRLELTENGAVPANTATDGSAGWTTMVSCGYANLTDGNKSSYWWPSFSSGSAFCEFHTATPVNITHYQLTTGNQKVSQDPRVWTLQARQNESDPWITIDSRDADVNVGDALPSKRTEPVLYTLQEPGTYQYFRFEVTRNGGAGNLCISDLSLKNLVAATATDPTFKCVAVTSAAPAAVSSSDGKVSFTGTYRPVGLDANDRANLYMGNGDALCFPTEGKTVNAFRAWFHLDSPTSRLGDVNGDRSIDVTDVTLLVRLILTSDDEGLVTANADINGDGAVSVTDVTALVNLILNGSTFNMFVSGVDGITFSNGGSEPARMRKH